MEEWGIVLFSISCLQYKQVTNFKIIWLQFQERMLLSEDKHISACCGQKKVTINVPIQAVLA